ncbi:MAG: phosphatidate cytidylyltransferase, partial [Marmoricola sp.]
MTDTTPAEASGPAPGSGPPDEGRSRAGRDLPKAIASGVALGAVIIASLVFWKPAFMLVVAVAVVVAIWELRRGFQVKGMDLPQEPLMLGGVVMVAVAFLYGAPALVTATAVTGLVTMLWLLRRGVDGFVSNATASIFTIFYVPFLGSFVSLLLAEGKGAQDKGVGAIVTFIVVTIASDIGGYIAGVLFGKHPMAPVISPKKSWEGFVGSAVACVAAGVVLVHYNFDGAWWIGVALGLIAVVMATLGDLCESV